MLIVKKLDLFILKKFLMIFFGAFFITLFVFMMQFTWRYVNELIGKGLTIDILSEFFWYMGITLVPMSLPLAILLASLISFGNMGEQLELLAMKASGVSLIRIMMPVFILVLGLATTSFYFQNKTAPEAQLKLRTLLFSMKQTSPALEIPEGVFYNGVPGFNLYVERKDVATGMLYNLMVYKTDQGFDRAQIVVADSGRMEMTTDKLHLLLDIWDGEQFENLQGGNTRALGTKNNPYDRETFRYKRFLIDFDANFEKMDEEQLRGMASAKNLKQLTESIDSLNAELDSLGRNYYASARKEYFPRPKLTSRQEVALRQLFAKNAQPRQIDFDTIVAAQSPEKLQRAMQQARINASSFSAELEWKSVAVKDGDKFIRRHYIEWHQKFTLSLACLFFFFIGAPLGAIIRKGGLGLPAVISVIIFIIYYIINTSGMKMARDGAWNMVFGMWISSAILAPTGAFLTYKANNDSVVFNMEAYMAILKRLFGFRSKRHIFRKEVIIEDPHYTELIGRISELRELCSSYNARHRLLSAPNYIHVFFRTVPDDGVERIEQLLEAFIDDLSNSRNPAILHELNQFPVLYAHAHTVPFSDSRLNAACGVLLPVGFLLWLRIWHFRLRLYRDFRQIRKSLDVLEQLIKQEIETR